MNILMINPVHPDTPHISAVRAWRFACEMAALGHKVVLLTASQEARDPDRITSLATHDWANVFILACGPLDRGRVKHVRSPGLLRKGLTAWRMLRHGGNDWRWSVDAVQVAKQLSEYFAPDVIWSTFGMMEAVIAAKRIAARAHRPWVLDIKDNWELYVPRGLRRLMAWRTRGWVAITANSRFTAEKALIWQRAAARVVYSGVDETFLERRPSLEAEASRFWINVVGGIYFTDQLEALLAGIESWASSLAPEMRSRAAVRYLGGDGKLFDEVATRRLLAIQFEVCGYVPLKQMASLCQTAALNSYVAHAGGFHHKLLELLACGRPVLACPAEDEEARDLASKASAELFEAAEPPQIAAVLEKVHQVWLRAPTQLSSAETFHRCSWAQQAKALEQTLAATTSSNRRHEAEVH
jgi:glycosyltransferase involved in cell wall biosynthesis